MSSPNVHIIGMINARGESKGIPRKNVRPLAGVPLIVWSIDAARRVAEIDRVIVSTEDQEIADVARQAGAEVPFMRPAELASDQSLQLDTIRYNVLKLEEDGQTVDIVVLMQPTSPFREPEDISGCIRLMLATDADTVVTISEANKFHPYGLWRRDPEGDSTRLTPYEETPKAGFNRQGLGPLYWRTGSVYAMRRHVIMDQNAIYGDQVHGYVVDAPRSFFNLDSQFDWDLAEAWCTHTGLAEARDSLAPWH